MSSQHSHGNFTNPYASPASVEADAASSETVPQFLLLARSVFLRWEKLRVVYCGLLLVLTMSFLAVYGHVDRRILLQIAAGAVAANLLYFAGPMIDTYVHWLGFKTTWPRWFMFCAGTLLSMLIASAILYEALR